MINNKKFDNSFANYMTNSRIKTTLIRADEYQTDPKKDIRLQEQKCLVCFYETYIAGQAFTQWKCAICGKEDNHHNTNTPTLCMDCAKENNVCHKCGADV